MSNVVEEIHSTPSFTASLLAHTYMFLSLITSLPNNQTLLDGFHKIVAFIIINQ